jgi:hypothetical protein
MLDEDKERTLNEERMMMQRRQPAVGLSGGRGRLAGRRTQAQGAGRERDGKAPKLGAAGDPAEMGAWHGSNAIN